MGVIVVMIPDVIVIMIIDNTFAISVTSDFDWCPCGGTHVQSTAEIGKVPANLAALVLRCLSPLLLSLPCIPRLHGLRLFKG